MTKFALLASCKGNAHLISELPYLLKKGGFHVTLLAYPHWSLTHSRYVDRFIEAPLTNPQIVEKVAKLAQENPFDFVLLGADPLIWALFESDLDLSVKTQIGPIHNRSYLYALEGKIGVAALCQKLQIKAPPSKVAKNPEQAIQMACKLGFPVMLKLSQSGAGTGVLKCRNEAEVRAAPISYLKPILIEKYLEGDLISVEPLFLKSRLVAYSYSLMTYSEDPFTPSLERVFTPCLEIEPILQKLGEELKINGFANLSLIRDRSSKEHFLFELDFRPNRWIRYGELVGVDWGQALQGSPFLQKPKTSLLLRHFPAHLQHALQKRKWRHLFEWAFNRKNSWRSIPVYDIRLILLGIYHQIRKALTPLKRKQIHRKKRR